MISTLLYVPTLMAVYFTLLGELSARALNKTKGIHEAKNPFAAPIMSIRELFTPSKSDGEDRNCIHAELSLASSGLTYQHGDHVGIWPMNSSTHVLLLLHSLSLYSKRNTIIQIDSLDPALAKVPFPTPTTYEAVLRHYLDVSAVPGRMALNVMSRYAPNERAGKVLSRLGGSKEAFAEFVGKPCLTLGEVLLLAAGDSPSLASSLSTEALEKGVGITQWLIPFDVIVSAIPRLQARYYSISSSPKMHPQAVHVTCVVLKYRNEPSGRAIVDGETEEEAKVCSTSSYHDYQRGRRLTGYTPI